MLGVHLVFYLKHWYKRDTLMHKFVLQVITLERDELESTVRRLQHEMSELKTSGSGDVELMHLRAAKHELERKLTDSEDDIGDLQQEMHELEMVRLTCLTGKYL